MISVVSAQARVSFPVHGFETGDQMEFHGINMKYDGFSFNFSFYQNFRHDWHGF